jgi:putative ABC transport system substrate-binding protein
VRASTPVAALIIAALTLGVLTAPWTASAQPAGKVARVGWLALEPRADPIAVHEIFLRRLRDLGYVEGRTLVFEGRWAEGEPHRLPGLAAELVRAGVDVLVTAGLPPTLAAAGVTTTTPIVMAGVGSPVERGLVASLGRPGGNVTGLSFDVGPALWGKRLELFKDAVPRLSRVGYLVDPATEYPANWKALQAAAHLLGLTLQRVDARAPDDFVPAFAAITRLRPDGLYIQGGAFYIAHRVSIVEFAAKRRIPAMYPVRVFIEPGGLMSYGPSLADLAIRAATYVHKIMNGAWPGELPVERPTKFELLVNLKTARALGLTIPQALLQRADEVIR